MSKVIRKMVVVSTAMLLSVGTAHFALADEGGAQRLEKALDSSKITLVQAIDIANQKVDGKVLEAEFHPRKEGNPTYDVEIFTKEKQIKEVRIDAVTSEILRNEVKDMDRPHRHKRHEH
ncbi:PepSY domain-containing protein [Gallibacterium salpingitidis]|uniref:PepSY domain-containing protein n=1 Tax=Gallibacterium salpingitidis TaxID=505341 RepID=UPI0008270E51|nr:PepSY domain-containing protein [Gallibacterium salpingitidis]